MKLPKLALLTILALPIPVVAALVSIHCSGVARTNTEPPVAEEVYSSGDWKTSRLNPGTSEGQTITSLVVSPAAIVGGRDSSGTVYLRYPAPAGGTNVSLNNDNASAARIPPLRRYAVQAAAAVPAALRRSCHQSCGAKPAMQGAAWP